VTNNSMARYGTVSLLVTAAYLNFSHQAVSPSSGDPLLWLAQTSGGEQQRVCHSSCTTSESNCQFFCLLRNNQLCAPQCRTQANQCHVQCDQR
jgi:hypothetical protein